MALLGAGARIQEMGFGKRRGPNRGEVGAGDGPGDSGRFVPTREHRILRESWIGLSVLTVLVGLAAGEIVIALVGSGVFVASWLARLWGRLALSRLDVTQTLSQDHAFVGETIHYRMQIANRKLLPLPWLTLRTEMPEALQPLGRRLEPIGTPKMARLDRTTGMRCYERLTWEYTIPLRERGFYAFGRTRLRAGDLFGFFVRERVIPAALSLWVYPRTLTLQTLGLPMLRPLGEERGRDPLFDDPTRLRGLRDYQAGDPLRRVDWRATAKRQSLQTRTFDPASSPSVLLALNVATMPEAWQGFYGELFERAVAVCASLASAYAEARFPFGLVANCTYPGRDGTIRLPLGRARAQTIRALESLAMVDVYAVAPIERVLAEESRRLPRGSSVALVTAVMTPSLQAGLIELRRRAFGVSIVWVGSTEPPPMPDAVGVHDVRASLDGLQLYQRGLPGDTSPGPGPPILDPASRNEGPELFEQAPPGNVAAREPIEPLEAGAVATRAGDGESAPAADRWERPREQKS